MDVYDSNTIKVLDYLKAERFCDTVIRKTERCFSSLREYLVTSGRTYSDSVAVTWMSTILGSGSNTKKATYKNAVIRLSEVYATGSVQTPRKTNRRCYFWNLIYSLRREFENYMSTLSPDYAEKTLNEHSRRISRFLLYCQKNGCTTLAEIDYALITNYHETELKQGSCQMGANAAIASFMNYLYNTKQKPYGYSIVNHYLGLNKGPFWNGIKPADMSKIIVAQKNKEPTLTLDEFLSTRNKIIDIYVGQNYSYAARMNFKQITDLLYLFLDFNGFQYNAKTGWIWCEALQPYWSKGRYLGARRPLFIFQQYVSGKDIDFTESYRGRITNYDIMPEWCKPAVNRYLSIKQMEGRKPQSIVNYRVPISKFCIYLSSIGINSFTQMDSRVLKNFNQSDEHKTSKGKNSYNSTIRKFIMYLDEEGWINNPCLFLALPCKCAPEEKIVEVLTEDEVQTLNKLLNSDNGCLTLRDKAILRLGIKMGIRPVDITNLKINDINWEKFTLDFIQSKTNVEVCFQMPPDVASAIYKYMMQERPDSKCDCVFISSRAPYESLQSTTCNRTMKKVLPSRDFYITRRTFATTLLRNNVKLDTVIDSLGQTSRHSIHRYLSLDEDRMKCCPISLKEYGIPLRVQWYKVKGIIQEKMKKSGGNASYGPRKGNTNPSPAPEKF